MIILIKIKLILYSNGWINLEKENVSLKNKLNKTKLCKNKEDCFSDESNNVILHRYHQKT